MPSITRRKAGIAISLAILLLLGASLRSVRYAVIRAFHGPPPVCHQRFEAVLGTAVPAKPPSVEAESYFEIDVSETARLAAGFLAPVAAHACASFETETLAHADADFVGRCGEAAKTQALGPAYACLRAWMRYRYVIADRYEWRLSFDPDSHAVLESLLYPALFNEPDLKPAEIAGVSERLVGAYRAERSPAGEPRAVFAARFAAQARYLQWLGAKGKLARAGAERALDRALATLKEMRDGDVILGELQLDKVRVKYGGTRLREEAREFKRNHLGSTTGDYYLAWAAELRNDRATAIWHLGSILGANPMDLRANFTLSRLGVAGGGVSQESPFLDYPASFSGIAFGLLPTVETQPR